MVLKRQVLTYASLANACLPCVAKRGKRASKQHLLYLGAVAKQLMLAYKL
jgi:hypothetical protein